MQIKGKRGVVFLILAILLAISFFPFVIGGLLAYLAYKKIPNRALKIATIAVIALVALPMGFSWAGALFSSDKPEPSLTTVIESPELVSEILPTVTPSESISAVAPTSTPQVEGVSDVGVLVTRVIDGDTIALEDGQKVRYIGVDTPESLHPNKAVECFAKEAFEKNKALVEGKRVRLEKDVSETDRYGRLLRYVYVGDTFVNDALVREGFAKASSYPPDVTYQDKLREAEQSARNNKWGLWVECPAQTPATQGVTDTKPLPTEKPAATTAPSSGSTSNVQQDVAPGACTIKGNIAADGEKIYHVPGCRSYNQTKIDPGRGEKYFCSEAEAKAAGWRKALNCP